MLWGRATCWSAIKGTTLSHLCILTGMHGILLFLWPFLDEEVRKEGRRKAKMRGKKEERGGASLCKVGDGRESIRKGPRSRLKEATLVRSSIASE